MNMLRFGTVVPLVSHSREKLEKMADWNSRIIYSNANKMAYLVTGQEDVQMVDQLDRYIRQRSDEKDTAGVNEGKRSLHYFAINSAYKDRFIFLETKYPEDIEIIKGGGSAL